MAQQANYSNRDSKFQPRINPNNSVGVSVLATFLISLMSPAVTAYAAEFQFTKIVESGDAKPGGGTFALIFDASISGDNIAFFGNSSTFTTPGIFAKFGANPITAIATNASSVPGGVGTFTALQCPSISGTNVVFQGRDSNPVDTGVSTMAKMGASPLSVIANQSTPIPSGSSTFTSLGLCPSISGSNVSFLGLRIPAFGNASDRQDGIYTTAGGLRRIADKTTSVPGGIGGTFNTAAAGNGNFGNPVIVGDDTTFRGVSDGSGVAHRGIYHFDGLSSSLTAVVDSTDSMPGAGGNFSKFTREDFDGQYVAFIAERGTSGIPTFAGVYIADVTTGAVTTVADISTTIPGTASIFALNNGFSSPFSAVAVDGGNVFFVADEMEPGSNFALFHWSSQSGELCRVIGVGDMLDSRALTSIGFKSQGGGVFDNGKLVVTAGFSGNTYGIFVVEENPPSCEPDNNDPTIECPDDLVVSADVDECSATNIDLGMAIADDFCGVDSVTNDAPMQFPLGDTVVTWTVTDTAGRMATCEQLVTVTDDQAPTITDCPEGIQVFTNGGCEQIATWSEPGVSDNCNLANFTSSHDSGDSFSVGETIVTYTATDDAGNVTTCDFTVTVIDDENPIIECPNAVTVNADANSCVATNVALGEVVATDNCSIDAITNDAPVEFPIGDTIVTWTVTDDPSGNSATCEQTVTVSDTEAPDLTCPSDLTVATDTGACSASGVDIGTPVANDLCGGVTVGNDAPATFPIGNTIVTWTATDDSGNVSTCQQTVTVVDGEAPTITNCPADQTLNANENCQASMPDLVGGVTSTDICDADLDVTQSVPAGDLLGLGDNIITITVTDDAGNSTTCTVNITVAENGCNNNEPPAQMDNDGVDDVTENGAPNNGDGNSDGTPDAMQNNVTSIPNANGNYLTIVAPEGTTLENVSVSGNPSPNDSPVGVEFPLGFISFSVAGLAPGASAQVSIIADLPDGVTIDTYWKFGPEPGAPDPHWYEFLFDGTTGATVNGNTVTMAFVDGQRGDDDLEANGTIVDPGAPGATTSGPITQPTPDCGTGLCGGGSAMMLPLMLVGLGLIRRRRHPYK